MSNKLVLNILVNGKIINHQSSVNNNIAIKKGDKIKIIKKLNEEEVLADNVLVVKSNNDLELLYEDGTKFTFNNFYLQSDAVISLPSSGSDVLTELTPFNAVASTSDVFGYVYSCGDKNILSNMASNYSPSVQQSLVKSYYENHDIKLVNNEQNLEKGSLDWVSGMQVLAGSLGIGAAVAAGGGGSSSAAGNDALTVSQGSVADGYIRGAKIYIDENSDGIAQESEYTGAETDSQGNFSISTSKKGAVLAIGGVNIDTGIENTVVLKAPAGSAIVNPLTTLVSQYMSDNIGTTASAAAAKIKTALGLDSSVDILSYDPLAATDPTDSIAIGTQKIAAQVATIMMEAKAVGGTDASVSTAVSNLVTATKNATVNAKVDLSDSVTMGTIFKELSGVDLNKVIISNNSIKNTTSLTEIVSAQAKALDKIPPAAPLSIDLLASSDSGLDKTDNITSNAESTVRVSFDTKAKDGTATSANNTIELYNENLKVVGSKKLTDIDIANGYVDFTLSTSSSIKLTAKITDLSLQKSKSSPALQITVDTLPPEVIIVTNNQLNQNIDGSAIIGFRFNETPALLPIFTPSVGELSTLVQNKLDPLLYTATLNLPNSQQNTTFGSITFSATSWKDLAGNSTPDQQTLKMVVNQLLGLNNLNWIHTDSGQGTPVMYIAKGQPVNIDLNKYGYDLDGDAVTVTINSATLPEGLSISNGIITGTATASGGSINVTLNDNIGTFTQTILLENVVAPTSGNSNNAYDKTLQKIYGESIPTVDPTSTFFGFNDNNKSMFQAIINDTSGTTADYNFNGSAFILDAEKGSTFSVLNTTDNSVTIDEGATVRSIVFSDAKEVTSINGVATPGLKQVTITMTVTAQDTTNLQDPTNWRTSSYTTWDQTLNNGAGGQVPITSLDVLKNTVLSKSNGGDIWINNNLVVKLNGTTESTSGTLVKMVWDGTYNKWTDTFGQERISEHRVTENEVSGGTWTLSNDYLTVEVPNQGTVIFKIDNSNETSKLMQTEMKPIGTTETQTLYYGQTIKEFQNIMTKISDIASPTATITMSDAELLAIETSDVTITFNEAVMNFTKDDVLVENGTIGEFSTTDNITWKATFTPASRIDDATNILTINKTYTDLAGNNPLSVFSSDNYVVNTVITG